MLLECRVKYEKVSHSVFFARGSKSRFAYISAKCWRNKEFMAQRRSFPWEQSLLPVHFSGNNSV